jgi:hypothetical protein
MRRVSFVWRNRKARAITLALVLLAACVVGEYSVRHIPEDSWSRLQGAEPLLFALPVSFRWLVILGASITLAALGWPSSNGDDSKCLGG